MSPNQPNKSPSQPNRRPSQPFSGSGCFQKISKGPSKTFIYDYLDIDIDIDSKCVPTILKKHVVLLFPYGRFFDGIVSTVPSKVPSLMALASSVKSVQESQPT